jgi:hypothetical protein
VTGTPSPAREVVALFERALDGGAPTPPSELLSLLLALHRNNLDQWQQEDLTRARGADDATVAAAKRAIDALNTTRHELVEALDAALADAVEQDPSATPATESPAMVYDRLSVLTIRIHFTEDAGYRARLPLLRNQLDIAVQALEGLFEDIRTGRKRFVPYQSLKLYGSSS